jgi:hypothetical protein
MEPFEIFRMVVEFCAACYLFWIIRRYFWLRNFCDNQLDMIKRVESTCESVEFKDGIPVVAVERFLHYIKHPDPGFGPTAILRHERDNQKTKIGSAI